MKKKETEQHLEQIEHNATALANQETTVHAINEGEREDFEQPESQNQDANNQNELNSKFQDTYILDKEPTDEELKDEFLNPKTTMTVEEASAEVHANKATEEEIAEEENEKDNDAKQQKSL